MTDRFAGRRNEPSDQSNNMSGGRPFMLRPRLTRLIIGLIAAVGVLTGAGKLLLGTAYAARQVVTRLGATIGAPVRVGEVSLGYIASTLRDVDVLETTPTAEPPAWTTCRGVD